MTDFSSEQGDFLDDITNPLDCVEEVMCANDWVFDRPGEDELRVQVTGKMGEYKLCFVWQESCGALQLYCQYDLEIPISRSLQAHQVMAQINEKMWIGHFGVKGGENCPYFRYTALFRGDFDGAITPPLHDIVNIALAECERFFPAFYLLSSPLQGEEIVKSEQSSSLHLALMPVFGES